MSDIQLLNSNYTRFYLKSDYSPRIRMAYLPIGWSEDDLEIVRHKTYHGIFTQFTDSLEFIDDEKDYILNALQIGGLNANVYLSKYTLVENNGVVEWDLDYIGIADFNEYTIKEGKLSVRFNSNKLEQLIASHESDTFELERLTSIDDEEISELDLKLTTIKGRMISGFGLNDLVNEAVNSSDLTFQSLIFDHIGGGPAEYDFKTSVSNITRRIHERQSSSDVHDATLVSYGPLVFEGDVASNMFFVDTEVETPEVISLDLVIKINCSTKPAFPSGGASASELTIKLVKLQYDPDNNRYFDVEDGESVTFISETWNDNETRYHDLEYTAHVELAWNQGLMLLYENYHFSTINLFKEDIEINYESIYPEITNVSCLFVHQAIDRLLEIISGKKGLLKSKVFGNLDIGYIADGTYGMVALTSGYWLRKFRATSDRYKSMQLALKKIIEDMRTVFNVGMGIQEINGVQKLRIEDLKYFYREKVVNYLGVVYNEQISGDKSMYFSGVELGYNKGGDYENEIGLDEPNTSTKWVTPLRKTANKYRKMADVRSDEYGMELTRRKPERLYPDEDTRFDEHNWLLDLKRTNVADYYTQKDWEDRLESEPTGILSPDTYRSFLFTPLRILLRHGWVIRAGMNEALNLVKKIIYASSEANTNLETHFIGEDEPFKENSDIVVGNLQRPKLLPITKKFNVVADERLLKHLMDYTTEVVEGEAEQIRNFLFKCEWTSSETGKIERGHILSYKPKSGEFEVQLSNEIIS